MKLEQQVCSLELAKQLRKVLCFFGLHSWAYSLREAQEKIPNFAISLKKDSDAVKALYKCTVCGKRCKNGTK